MVPSSVTNTLIKSPTCAGNGVATVTVLNNATLVGTLDQSVGTHEANFKSTPGHLFANGTDTFKNAYSIHAPLTANQRATLLLKASTADVAVLSPACAAGAQDVAPVASPVAGPDLFAPEDPFAAPPGTGPAPATTTGPTGRRSPTRSGSRAGAIHLRASGALCATSFFF